MQEITENLGPVPDNERYEIEAFLYREARALDERDYDTWLSMLAPDINYWMPVIENRMKEDPKGPYSREGFAYFDDSIEDLKRRVKRFQLDTTWMENPPTRHVHVISNIEVERGETDNEVIAYSAFINYRNRGERDEDVLYGRRRDAIRKDSGTWLLVRRRIVIAQNVLLSKDLNTFL